MRLTAFEQGKRSPAELSPELRPGRVAKPAPHINRRFDLTDAEKQRRRDILTKAITKAETIPRLSRAIGIRPMTIRNWDLAKHAIPNERLTLLEDYLAEEDPA